jgi:hypothetical protein
LTLIRLSSAIALGRSDHVIVGATKSFSLKQMGLT